MLNNNRGIALILVLWILLALILLAAGIGMLTRTETEISRNYADVTRCRWAARAGVYRSFTELTTINSGQTTYLGEEPYTLTSDDSNTDLGGYTYQATINDETGRVNINTASNEMLATLFGSSDIADCIIDWRDADDTPSAQGVESEYYATLDPPYKCRNTNFDTIRELLLVKGITEEILSTPVVEGSLPLINLITVYQPIAAQQTSTSNLVDIQTADQQSLQRSFGSILSAQDIAAIIAYRRRTAFKSPAEIIQVPGLSRSKVEQIYDRLTVSGVQAKSGLVNVNTANADVLAVLPGMDSSIAQAIIDYRTNHAAFEGVGNLLEVSDVTSEAFVGAAPYLSIKSNIFRITSTGRFDKNGASATITCVVEVNGSSGPQIRYWQE